MRGGSRPYRDRYQERQALARHRATLRDCIADIVREGRPLFVGELLREWAEWGCPYAAPYARVIAASVLDDYLAACARGRPEVCA